ncbi:TetR/AcrR family transcriptional regulator [Paenibacillus paeoniae]|uniref:TetR/AcrR family transcriptional regulator n=1 Tax=Paenibacillus paeoniae TaxID=2292705 RepID=A0A371PJN2_9BACL|nr:TetR/AcrR family transcriptional regulator [Paenibacillus paeoniae]REK76406.1 TetR/AcrR family transcriptional regulator [Paenibacillus paeoniae]
MVRQREFDTEKALNAAMYIFWEKGFEASSLRDLTGGMGIQRPSLYGAFGDKQELFEAALRRYNAWHASQVRSRLQRGVSVKAAFRELFEQIGLEENKKSEIHRGCFCINTMVELAPHDSKFAVLTREHQMYLAAIFKEVIEYGQQKGELSVGLHAEALAQSLVISMIGLTVMVKSKPDEAFIRQSIDMTLSLLDGGK